MQRDVTLVLGTDGTGKTTLADRLSHRGNRVLILDAGFSQFRAENCADIDAAAKRLGELRAFGTSAPFRISFTPLPDEIDLAFLLARDLGDCTVVAEEADRFRTMGPWQTDYIYRGRHWGVSIIAVTIQPYALPKDLRRIVREVFAYRMTEESDIEYLAGIVGDAAYSVPSLRGPGKNSSPPYDHLHWEVGNEAKIIYPRGAPRARAGANSVDASAGGERALPSSGGESPGDDMQAPAAGDIPEESLD